MAANPQLADHAEQLRQNDAYIASAFAPIADKPIDPELMAALGLTPLQPANDNSPWYRRHRLPLGGALAASIAALAVLGLNIARAPHDPVSLALDSTASGEAVRLADGRDFEAILTVQARDGRWCREYTLGRDRQLACREGSHWHVEATDRAQSGGANGEGILAGAARSEALEAAYARLQAGDPLEKGAEDRLLAARWR